jgi:hypothetical protein
MFTLEALYEIKKKLTKEEYKDYLVACIHDYMYRLEHNLI